MAPALATQLSVRDILLGMNESSRTSGCKDFMESNHHAFDHLDKLFGIVADQRMKTFNYYALILGATTAGTISLLTKESVPLLVIALVGVAHMVVAWVFYCMDRRTRGFVSRIRRAYGHLEKQGGDELDDGMKIFTKDEKHSKVFSYSRAFNTLFGFHALMGLSLVAKGLGLWSLPS
jgi:hypothetical protein